MFYTCVDTVRAHSPDDIGISTREAIEFFNSKRFLDREEKGGKSSQVN